MLQTALMGWVAAVEHSNLQLVSPEGPCKAAPVTIYLIAKAVLRLPGLRDMGSVQP